MRSLERAWLYAALIWAFVYFVGASIMLARPRSTASTSPPLAAAAPPHATAEPPPRLSKYVSVQNVTDFRNLNLDWHDLVPKKIKSMERLVKIEREITKALLGVVGDEYAAYGKIHSNIPEMDARLKKCSTMDGKARANEIFRIDSTPVDESVDLMHVFARPNNHKPLAKVDCAFHSDKIFVPLARGGGRPSIQGKQKAMFYHFLREVLKGFVSENWESAQHVVVVLPDDVGYDWELLPWIEALATDSCAIRLGDLPVGACGKVREHSPGISTTNLREIAIERFGLKEADEPTGFGLIHRLHKRLIVNSAQLVESVSSCHDDQAVALPFELMTPFEQVRSVYSLKTLAGVHGSGLSNAVFLPRNSKLFEILPARVSAAGLFFKYFCQSRCEYFSLKIPRKEVFLHKHFLSAEEQQGIEEKLASPVRLQTSGSFFFSFLINQDLKPDPQLFRRYVCGS